MSLGELIIYQDQNDTNFQLEVRIEDETVWLTQIQMAELFQTTRNNITLHISNIFKEKELTIDSVSKESLLTAADGKNYKTKIYNLDVIISVGYRVKSQRGTQFRIWANKILKNYLLNGYAIHHRFEKIENDVYLLKQKTNEFDILLKTSLPQHEGIFYDGQVFDAYVFAANIIKQAKKSIVIIDNYVDESVLTLLTKRSKNVTATIYTNNNSKQLQLDTKKHNLQYEPIIIKTYTKAHDRFIIIDNIDVFHIGASLKDLGNKWFAFSKIRIDASEMIKKLEND